MKAYLLFCLFIAGISTAVIAQTNNSQNSKSFTDENCYPSFRKVYKGSKADYAYGADSTHDGGLVVTGTTNSNSTGSTDGLVMKVDGNGEIVWSKAIDGSGDDYLQKIKSTSDGGYIAVGRRSPQGGGSVAVAWMIKLDASGTVQWAKQYDDGNPYGSRATNVCETSDGGYAFCGNNDDAPGVSNAMVVKTDNMGNVQWAKSFNSGNTDLSWGLMQFENSLIVTAFQYGESDSYYDGIVMRLDINNGSITWARQYDIDYRNNSFSDIYKTENSFSLFSLDLDNFSGGGNAATIIVKMNEDGSPISLTKVSLTNPYNLGHGASTPTRDRGYLITQAGLGNQGDLYVFKISNGNTLQWMKRINNDGQRAITQILQLEDGGLLAAGYNNNRANSFVDSFNVFVQKTDSLGDIRGCHFTTAGVVVNTPDYTYYPNFTWSSVTDLTFIEPLTITTTVEDISFHITKTCYSCGGGGKPGLLNEQLATPNLLVLYPNPAKDFILLSCKANTSTMNAVVSIADVYGKPLLQQMLANTTNQFQRINISNLMKGVYTVTLITQDGQRFTQKFMKE